MIAKAAPTLHNQVFIIFENKLIRRNVKYLSYFERNARYYRLMDLEMA